MIESSVSFIVNKHERNMHRASRALLFILGLMSCSVLVAKTEAAPSQAKTQQKKSIRCDYFKKYNEKTKQYYFVTHCEKQKTFNQKIETLLTSLTSEQHSALQQRIEQQKKVDKSKYGILFYEPTYIIPFYYTGRPYGQIYQGHTPENQSLMHEEFKGQVSLLVPLWIDIFHSTYSLNATYTQLSYWQFYAESQYFRETNYEPSIFISNNFHKNWLASVGIVHQSNGRGIPLERSWNRLFFDLSFSGKHWLVDVKPWILVFKTESTDLHNPDIANFLGHERVVLAYKLGSQEFSVMFRNTIESGFHRGAIELTYAFPIHGKVSGYIQFFSGYGQSLIEYNHYTNSAGAGLIFSNWI